MAGLWLFLGGITLYVIGSVIEKFAELVRGKEEKEEE